MIEETSPHGERRHSTLLQLGEEMLTVKLVDFLDVAEYDVALTAQGLGDVLAGEFGDVVLRDRG